MDRRSFLKALTIIPAAIAAAPLAKLLPVKAAPSGVMTWATLDHAFQTMDMEFATPDFIVVPRFVRLRMEQTRLLSRAFNREFLFGREVVSPEYVVTTQHSDDGKTWRDA